MLDENKLRQFRQAAIKAGYKPKDIDALIKKKRAEQATIDLAQEGLIDVKDVATENPVLAKKIMESGVKPEQEKTAAQEKSETKAAELESIIDLLEQNLKEVEARGPLAGRLGSIASFLTSGGINPEIADYNSLRKGLIGPVARVISQEVGVMTDRDIKRAEGLLPKSTDSAELAAKKFTNLRKVLAEKRGAPAPKETEPIKGGGLIDMLIGGAKRTFQDIGTGIAMKRSGAQQSQADALATLQRASQRAKTVDDPEQRRRLLQVAGEGSQRVGQESRALSGMFTEDIDKSIPERSLEAGTDIAFTSALVSALINIPRGAGKFSTKLKAGKLNPQTVLGEARKEAAKSSKVKISGNKLAKAGEKYLKNDPLAKPLAKKILPTIKGKTFTPAQLLERMKVWGNAYTSAGKVGKSSKAGLFNTLYKAGGAEMKAKAPEVAKYTNLLRLSFQIPKNIQKGAWTALKFTGLGRMLGL